MPKGCEKIEDSLVSMNPRTHITAMKMGVGGAPAALSGLPRVGGATKGSACRLHPGLKLLSPLRGGSRLRIFGLHRNPQ